MAKLRPKLSIIIVFFNRSCHLVCFADGMDWCGRKFENNIVIHFLVLILMLWANLWERISIVDSFDFIPISYIMTFWISCIAYFNNHLQSFLVSINTIHISLIFVNIPIKHSTANSAIVWPECVSQTATSMCMKCSASVLYHPLRRSSSSHRPECVAKLAINRIELSACR